MSVVAGIPVVISPAVDVTPPSRVVMVFGHAKHGPMSACVVLIPSGGDRSPMLNTMPLKAHRGHLMERRRRMAWLSDGLPRWSAACLMETVLCLRPSDESISNGMQSMVTTWLGIDAREQSTITMGCGLGMGWQSI